MDEKEFEEKRRKLWFMCALSIVTTDEKIAERVANMIVNKIKTREDFELVVETMRNRGLISKEVAEKLLKSKNVEN